MLATLIPTARDLTRARADIGRSFEAIEIWLSLAAFELRQRYRRSFLGMLWMPISTAVVVLVMGFLISAVWGNKIDRYLPFLTIGIIIWNYINNSIQTATQSFTSEAMNILQFARPYSSYVIKTVTTETIKALHSVPVFLLVIAAFGLWPSETYLLLLISLPLLLLNIGWMALTVAVITVRFRDVAMIIQNAFTPLFWLTPVLYELDQLTGTVRTLILLNPLTHVMEVARSPFLNEYPSLLNWGVALGMAVAGWAFAFAVFARFRPRIAYWL